MNDNIKFIHKYDNKILDIALNIAKKSDMRCKHGCVIIDNRGNIISTAFNNSIITSKDKLYSINKCHNITIHAEEKALRNVDHKKLLGAILYVVRYDILTEEDFMNSKPCKRCTIIIEKYMKKFGLKKVYYTI